MSAITSHTEKNELIWNKASEFLANWLRLYHNIGQKTLFLLSGGSVTNLYTDLTKFINTSELNFDFLVFAQVDERFKPPHKADINAHVITETRLLKVCHKKNIPYYLIPQEGTLKEAAEKYNKQLSDLFEHATYKICVLGIGEDAHTAGLLPGYKKDWNKDLYTVGYRNNGRFSQRITVTPEVLYDLDQAIVVAVGEKKKEAIKSALNPLNIDNTGKYPAAILQKMEKVDLFTDITNLNLQINFSDSATPRKI